jgi:uncharacterized coiled-coil DUF342 family protein
MKLHRSGWYIPVLLVCLGAPLSAESSGSIPYVDMSTAQTLVDTLVKENESLGADASSLRKQAATVTDQITAAKKSLDDFLPLLDEVRARISELATITEELVDRVLKAKALNAMDKNKAAEKKVKTKIDELSAIIVALPKQIETLVFQIAVDNAKIARNNDDIVLLQATISRTKVQETRLNTILTDIDTTSAKVDSFIQQSGSTAAPAKK